jgi:Na+-transporting methylmalonyl-CoA/oxaloacetate decarboxylase gamma subunit
MNFNNMLEAIGHLAGLGVVIFALTCLWALTALMSWVVARFERPSVAPVRPTVQAENLDSTDDDAVVVAAAVTMMLGSTARVVAVQPLPSSWADHGRRDIHVSHRVR